MSVNNNNNRPTDCTDCTRLKILYTSRLKSNENGFQRVGKKVLGKKPSGLVFGSFNGYWSETSMVVVGMVVAVMVVVKEVGFKF